MKYGNAFQALSELFASSQLPVWPRDVVPLNPPLPHGVVTFIPNGTGVNYGSVSGIVIVDIKIAPGVGPVSAHAFADTLDDFLVKRSHKNTQFFASSLAPRSDFYEYTVNFKHFGT